MGEAEVPDELPALPAAAPAPTAAAPVAAPPPAPVAAAPPALPSPTVDPSPPTIAPPELPKNLELPKFEPHLPGTYPPHIDQKLFFSRLITDFHKESPIKGGTDIIADLQKNWQDQKLQNKLDEIDTELAQKSKPLQELEKEWRILQFEIDGRQERLKMVEDELHKGVRDIQLLLERRESLSRLLGQ